MDYVIQLAKRKNLSKFQRSGVFLLFLLALSKESFLVVERYFGVDQFSKKDKILWYGFYSFCSLVALIAMVVVHA